MTLVYK